MTLNCWAAEIIKQECKKHFTLKITAKSPEFPDAHRALLKEEVMNKAVNMTPSPLLWNISLAGRAYHFPKTIIFLTFDKLTLGYFQLNMQFQGFAQLHILFLVHWLFLKKQGYRWSMRFSKFYCELRKVTLYILTSDTIRFSLVRAVV